MRLVDRIKIPVKTAKEIEQMAAKLAKQEAMLDYVAIMADVELPDENEEVSDYE